MSSGTVRWAASRRPLWVRLRNCARVGKVGFSADPGIGDPLLRQRSRTLVYDGILLWQKSNFDLRQAAGVYSLPS